jgi:hypothetical protein
VFAPAGMERYRGQIVEQFPERCVVRGRKAKKKISDENDSSRAWRRLLMVMKSNEAIASLEWTAGKQTERKGSQFWEMIRTKPR